ncbi:hypothetical protein PVK06_008034 [Gossypium arboreum]|uniref:Uncharacterized protein n=1 Tax=Gossypium arboreum TaxID=29729 RepID=A0ABR0QKA2_GOSAR|nr:hypothetical protein PVK06_008034 [Gossypium arboreum]
MHLRLDIDVQMSEAEKLRKGKSKVEEDLDSLKTDYKKLRLSMRTAGLGKTSEQWRQEIREEKTKADQWERKFQEAQAQNGDLEKSLSESRNERGELRARVAELKKSLHQYQCHNTAMELRASLSKVEEMKGKIEELEASLQSCEMRIEFFEQEMKDQMMESQREMMSQLSQLLMGRMDKGKGPMDNVGENNEDPQYPPGFTPTHIPAQPEINLQRLSVTIRP